MDALCVPLTMISPDQRVWVLLDLIGRTTRVAVQPGVLQVV